MKKRGKRRPVRKLRARRSKRQAPGAIRIFAKLELGQELAKRMTVAPPRTEFDRAVTLEGKTPHFQVYYQTGFASGPAITNGVLATCERDHSTLEGFFGNIALPNLPMNIIVAPGIGGAYHHGCGAVDLHCDGADLDRAVDLCYRPQPFDTDRQRVEHLFALYEKFTAPFIATAKKGRRKT